MFASGTIQDWARDEVEIEVKISKTEENQLDKNFTLLPTNKDKEDTSSQNEGKATDREESTEITSAENEASAYSSVIKRRDDSDQHSGDHKEVTIVQY